MTHLKQGDKPEVMLKAVIEKAVRNGYRDRDDELPQGEIKRQIDFIYYSRREIELLFEHRFAKAYWGEKPQKVYGGIWNTYSEKPTTIELHEIKIWQYHLQQAVLSENPLLYYYERL